MSKGNIVRWVEAALDEGESIEAVVIGGGDSYTRRDEHSEFFGQRLTWAEARPMLDYDFNCGYGSGQCHSVIIWTGSRILFIHEYDGSTSLHWQPRNPVAIIPEYSGFWFDDEDDD